RGPGLTAIATSTGARTTLGRDIPLGYLATVVSWIDPAVDVIFAEGNEDSGATAVELRPAGVAPLGVPEEELLAVVDPEDLATAFAERGPGYTAGVAERVLGSVLRRAPSARSGEASDGGAAAEVAPAVEREIGRLARLFRRMRG